MLNNEKIWEKKKKEKKEESVKKNAGCPQQVCILVKKNKHQIVFGIDFKEHNYNNYIQDD